MQDDSKKARVRYYGHFRQPPGPQRAAGGAIRFLGHERVRPRAGQAAPPRPSRTVTKRRFRCASQAIPFSTSVLLQGVSRSMPSLRPCSSTHPVTSPVAGFILAMHSVIQTFAHTWTAENAGAGGCGAGCVNHGNELMPPQTASGIAQEFTALQRDFPEGSAAP